MSHTVLFLVGLDFGGLDEFFHPGYQGVSAAQNIDGDLIGFCLAFHREVRPHYDYPCKEQENPRSGDTANPIFREIRSLEIGNRGKEEHIPSCKVIAEAGYGGFEDMGLLRMTKFVSYDSILLLLV